VDEPQLSSNLVSPWIQNVGVIDFEVMISVVEICLNFQP
jgi:hypothetical protein